MSAPNSQPSSPPQTPSRSRSTSKLSQTRPSAQALSPLSKATSLPGGGPGQGHLSSSSSASAQRPGPRVVSSPLSGAASAAPERSRSRAKDLLRKHYGLAVGPPVPSGGNRSADPMDLDSPAFDARAYYDQLITTSSLTALLKKENELLTDMRELESERQSLVYNHHHELIAATDTISAMKTRAESLDADLDLLKVAFSEISRLSAEVAVEMRRPDAPSRL